MLDEVRGDFEMDAEDANGGSPSALDVDDGERGALGADRGDESDAEGDKGKTPLEDEVIIHEVALHNSDDFEWEGPGLDLDDDKPIPMGYPGYGMWHVRAVMPYN